MQQIPFPNKKYQVIYADPPWDVKRGPGWNSSGKSRDLAYPTMSLEDIFSLPVKSIADDNCKLFLWGINKYMPETYRLLDYWGFKYSTTLIWAKRPNGIGLGGTFSLSSEFLLFGVKGRVNSAKRHDTNWWLEKRGSHSTKPEKFRNIIEETFPNDKKVELFARQKTNGWDAWGNEV